MNPLVMAIIMFTIFSGTMITMTSSHWLLAWMGMEMNMLAFIPILMKKSTPRSTEAAAKYFITQATASMILMMAILINASYTGQWTIMKVANYPASLMITIALMMKLGLAPFHFWVPEVTQGVPLQAGMLLLTWQKLAPISILCQISTSLNTTLTTLTALTSILVGGWGGLNQTQLRKIMAYSSIAHMGWMIAILPYSIPATILNLLIYILITTAVFMILMLNNTTTTLMLSQLWNSTPLLTTMLMMLLLSLGGLPPLTGFLPKWIIIQEMTKNDSIIVPTLMAMMALLNLYFYMRLIYSTSLTLFPSSNNTKMKMKFESKKSMTLLPPIIVITTMTLPLGPLTSTLL
uniref:NADH-ubiquinone oxidoreductase chain 2 n=1 Tax=Tupaia montana TaxID=1035795 RepID=A0A873HUX2_9EUTH|nr:NADH dehydrogenase subunit 2 [Tupaia montana]QOZ41300.1 NADH dehydrogenase subunit 2 [Tupaia montana]QOZ41313.1 NADH dehydrogenase subunit 2 [Tupaia montana]QOZ41326.1 NADH dehydrogenase subunit 2 [Tupaia montana]QOZ41339.1 NADH dehydrogenase subunit 2 [Tupaia montana]